MLPPRRCASPTVAPRAPSVQLSAPRLSMARRDCKRQAVDTAAFDAEKAKRAARFGVPLKPTVAKDDSVKAKRPDGKGSKKAAAPVRCPCCRRPGCPSDPGHPWCRLSVVTPPPAARMAGSLSRGA